jgi:hypothetical protein
MAMQLFARPTTDRPTVSDADAKAEAQLQAEYIVRADLDDQKRLKDVAARIYAANRELCPETAPKLGLSFAYPAQYGAKLLPAARAVIPGGDGVHISHVMKDWAGDRAGVKVGDIVTSVDGVVVGDGAAGAKALSAQLAKHLRTPETPVRLTVVRDGKPVEVSATLQSECAYDINLVKSDELNAYADGESINITTGIMRFTRSDDELALVVAHETAHNTEGHLKAKRRNATVGAIGGGLLDIAIAAAAGYNTQGAFSKAAAQSGAEAYSPEFESEADYVGLYFMARAGYDTSRVGDFWRRMSVESPQAVFIKTSHPTNPSRYLAINSTAKQIQGKKEAGEPLVPQRLTAK